MQTALDQAYAQCFKLVRQHYENFPVASFLLPKPLRRPVAAIYAFARTADDIADEGPGNASERLAKLDNFRAQFHSREPVAPIYAPLFLAVHDCVKHYHLPVALLEDLLSAFRQDILKTRYADFNELMDYCRRSANPIGRLLLHLVGYTSEQQLAWSDNICSALQLINFLQDMAQDYDENQRIYIPQDEQDHHAVSDTHFRDKSCDAAMQALFQQQVSRATAMLQAGAPLGQAVKGRFGWQLRLMIAGGLQICHALSRLSNNCFARPRLGPLDWFSMLKYAIIPNSVT